MHSDYLSIWDHSWQTVIDRWGRCSQDHRQCHNGGRCLGFIVHMCCDLQSCSLMLANSDTSDILILWTTLFRKSSWKWMAFTRFLIYCEKKKPWNLGRQRARIALWKCHRWWRREGVGHCIGFHQGYGRHGYGMVRCLARVANRSSW